MKRAHIVRLLADANVPHAHEIANGIVSGTLQLVEENPGSGCSCDELYYLHRLRSMPERDGTPSEHALRMQREAKHMAERLVLFPGKKCHAIIVEGPPNVSYTILVLVDGSEVIGCTWGLDARKTPREEWDRLWRGTPSA